MREVFGGAQRAKWVALGKARSAIDGRAGAKVQAVLNALLATDGQWTDPDNAFCADEPLNIAAEVQLIYEPYLSKGRKLSHLPYKVVRCEVVSELARDASGKHVEGREAIKAAEAECMRIVVT